MGVRNPNSTNYEHPDEPNLLNLHKSMQYNNDGQPQVRVHVDGISLQGDVIVDKVKLWDGTNNLSFDLPNNDGETAPWSLPTESHNMVFNGSTWDRMRGNINDGVLTQISNDYLAISKDTSANSDSNRIFVNTTGTVELGTTTLAALETITVNQGTNPWVTTVSNTTPITVAQADVAVTAFDEPLAVGITPIIQADVTYGIDPDFWVTTKLNSGDITVTSDNTFQVQSGTSAGGYARLATSKYMTYQPGQGSMYRWTAAFTATGTTKTATGVDNIVQNTGPIDREDGYSFGYSGDPANRTIGILHRRAGRAETRSFTVTTAPTGAQTAVFTLNGVAYTISLTASTSVQYTANQIADRLKAITTAKNTWDIEGCNGVVTFTYYSPGPKSGTYSFSCSGTGTLCAGTLAQLAAGVTPTDTWTYVDQWDNQNIQFDPTKLNVYAVDFRWLGAGRVRFLMEDPNTGKMVLVHTQKWSGRYLVPHVTRPSLRIAYRSGTTNPAITPSQNVVVTGASVFSGVQGIINQTGSSQGAYSVDSTTRSKDIVYHLMSVQNPFVRNGGVNKASLAIQTLTVAAQANDPSVIYIVKNAQGLSDVLVFRAIPNTTVAMFAQYSTSVVTENLDVDRLCNVQTLGINGTATFDLKSYNLNIAPGETISVFISSTNAINRTATGITWNVD